MKHFKLKGLDKYVINVYSIEVAVVLCLRSRIGITEKDLEPYEANIPEGYPSAVVNYEQLILVER